MDLVRGQLRALLGCIAELESADDARSYPQTALAAIGGLIACDMVTYNEVDTGTPEILWEVDPPDALDFPDAAESFAAHVHEHPVIAHYQHTRDPGTLKISDFLTRLQFRRLGLYQDFFRILGTGQQMP